MINSSRSRQTYQPLIELSADSTTEQSATMQQSSANHEPNSLLAPPPGDAVRFTQLKQIENHIQRMPPSYVCAISQLQNNCPLKAIPYLKETLYSRANTKAHRYAHYMLGALYFHGQGDIKQDCTRAFHHLKKAADDFHPEALYSVAMMLIEGRGCTQDYQTGQRYLELAKLSGHTKATKLIENGGSIFSTDEQSHLHQQVQQYNKNHITESNIIESHLFKAPYHQPTRIYTATTIHSQHDLAQLKDSEIWNTLTIYLSDFSSNSTPIQFPNNLSVNGTLLICWSPENPTGQHIEPHLRLTNKAPINLLLDEGYELECPDLFKDFGWLDDFESGHETQD